MAHKIDKEALIKNFSRYAHLYDRYADVQRFAAHELIKDVPRQRWKDILEIGCGTGIYTELLKKRFKDAEIKAVDLSCRMLDVARHKFERHGVDFITGDAENISFERDFDLVTSNAAFQWFEDLKKSLTTFKNALKAGGMMAFSVFGPLTFWELSCVLKDILDDAGSTNAERFLSKDELKTMLLEHFNSVSVTEITIKERYRSFYDLLAKIKYTGARGNGSNGFFLWQRRLLAKAEDLYRKRFGAIEATYQIFLCNAQG